MSGPARTKISWTVFCVSRGGIELLAGAARIDQIKSRIQLASSYQKNLTRVSLIYTKIHFLLLELSRLWDIRNCETVKVNLFFYLSRWQLQVEHSFQLSFFFFFFLADSTCFSKFQLSVPEDILAKPDSELSMSAWSFFFTKPQVLLIFEFQCL